MNQSCSCPSWEAGARRSIGFHCLCLLPNCCTSTRRSQEASSNPQPVAAASHSCIFHNFKSNCNADFLIGKWKIVLCMTQLLRHYCQKGGRRRTKSGADTAFTVTSTRPRRMENESRVRGNGDGVHLICCKTGESAHAAHCTLLYIT